MKKLILFIATIAFAGTISAQNNISNNNQISNGANSSNLETLSPSDYKSIKAGSVGVTQTATTALTTSKTVIVDDSTNLPLSPNGKLLSVDGFEVDFLVPSKPEVSNICYTPSPIVNGSAKNASCPFTVPCDDPSNRDVSSYTTQKYVQLVWHVMWDGGAISNIDQARIDNLMTELNADYASHNVIFCADPATFYEDAANYTHDSGTEEWQLKDLYNVTPTDVCNIYVVGDMTAGGYARFPYDPNGGTDAHGGIVLNRGNCSVGTHTLAHEMGHTMGLEHTFAGVDERTECSSCYERVRNANGSSNASGAATLLGGPYLDQGDREGDWCSDTNPHDTYSYNCSTSSNTNGACDSGPWANAPVNNHMSYSFCSSQFTNQQDRRMHCMMDSYLGTWTAYGGGLCGAQPPVADFVGTPTTWQAPSNVNFTDLSTPQAIVTGWTWTFDVGASATVTCAGCAGANATFIGQVPPAVTYPNPGLYTVSLTITSANGPDTETKIDYIEVLAPAGDCDTLDTQWENPTPTPSIYTFGGGYLTGVQDPTNSLLPTDLKGVYEMYFTPNPGVTQVGAVRVGLGFLEDADNDMVIQVLVFDDDGFGAPGALLGGVGGISPTNMGVPGAGFFNEFWIPFNNAVVPTTGTFHVGVEMIPGDPTDSILVVSSQAGQGEGDFSNHIWTTGFGYENFQTVYGIDFDLDIIPMLGEYAPLPLITGFTENVVCDTTYVTLFDTALYSSVASWSFIFSDGTIINTVTDPMTIDRVYTSPGPDTVTIAVVNDCGRADTTTWVIPYGFLSTPDAEFSATPLNPICMGAPGVDFTADVPGYVDYSWDFGDGTVITSSGNVETINHIYTVPGTYYVELTTTEAGYNAADTFYLENFEGGWPAGYDRYNNDIWTPDPGVNPPFTGTNATAWLPLDIDGDGDVEAVSTSWNINVGELADDWMLTTGIGALPPNQRLFWDAEALDVSFPDGYEVRISNTQLPANVGNYSTLLYSTGAENAFNTTHSVDLSTYVGQTVYIAFVNNSDWMYLLSIDNIRVGSATPGCNASILKTDYIEIIDCTVLPPVTVLNADVSSGCGPLTVTFTDATVAGDPAISWLWNFGDGTFSTDQSPIPHVYTTGSYYVIFESCNTGGCSQDTITITVGDPATLTSVVTVDPTCANNDGSITINATGGTGTLLYSVDNGVTFQASNVFNGLAAGTYDVIVEDAIGCQVTSTEILVAAAGPSITLVASTDPLCLGGTGGSIVITAAGGTGALTYSIDNGVTFQAGNTFLGLGAGIYDIVVEDASGCQATQSVTLIDGVSPTIDSFTTVDVLCFGDLTGSITITASGGTGVIQYQYDANPLQASNVITGLGAGSYSITIEDANGCQATATPVIINEPATAVSITGTVDTDPSCNGLLDGDITVTAIGGTGVIQYSNDNGVTFQAGNSFAGLGAGTYNIVVEDANGCQATLSVTLVDPSVVTITVVTSVDPTCIGNDGSIDITASGGTGALTYSIDNGVTFQPGNTFAGLIGGTYNIVVEDVNGCQATAIEVLIASSSPIITGVITVDPTCIGNDGTIDITASGGTGALTYSIDNGVTFQAGNTFAGLVGATYDIVVEDANGCQATTSVILVASSSPIITGVISVDPTCIGNDGTIDITASGGTGALTYSIDNGVTFQAGNTFAGLVGATYNIVVEDANGCQATTTATLNPSATPTITVVNSTDPLCALSLDGTIDITAAGGIGALQYSIDNGVTFQPGNTFGGLGAGVYNIVVEDVNGCQATSSVTLIDPIVLVITAVTTVDPTCAGGDGSIDITASGGTGALTYSIDNGVTFQAGNTFGLLNAGTYNIVVEDANGCQVTSIEILTAAGGPIITGVVVTDPTCAGGLNGDITITATGTAVLLYSIDNGVTFQAGNNFAGLGAAIYNIVVEDGSGCQTTSTGTLIDPPAVAITLVASTDPTCNAGLDGDITITASGGTGALTYSIDNGVTFQAGNNFTGLSAATYNIVVEDANGCQTTGTATLVDPAIVTYTVTIIDENCGLSDGQIDLIGAGGDGGPYTYSIDNGVTFQASGTFPGLTFGPYNVVIEDGLGCQTTAVETVSGTGGPSITLITEDVSLICNGDCNGQLTATVSGGVLPYLFEWVDGASIPVGGNSITVNGLCADTYTLTVTDNNGAGCPTVLSYVLGEPTAVTYTTTVIDESCGNVNGQIDITGAAGGSGAGYQYSVDNGVTFQAGGTFPGLGANAYNVVVEDGNGCPATSIETILNIAGPSISGIVTTDPTCGAANGDITITATGGTGVLQYSIDNGVTFQAGNNFAGLIAALYDVVVEDANGCQVTQSITLTDLGAPTITSATPTDPTCGFANGDITIVASGGTGALQYSIDNGVTFQAGGFFPGLIDATYDVVIEDANGCQAFQTVILVNSTPPVITNVVSVDPACGNPDGTIDITASGGTGALQYSIDNGATFQAGNTFAGLGAGLYDIVVEDANGCQAISSVTLVSVASPTITSVTVIDPTCGNANGDITIAATGGVGALQYSIDNGVTFQAGNNFPGLIAGIYDVVVEDANGCQAVSTATLVDLGAPIITGVVTVDASCGNADGSIDITASGGTGALQYSIDNGVTFQAGNIFLALIDATYDVVVEDANGCQATQTVVIANSTAPIITNVTTVDPSCGNPNGSIDITATGGTGALQYSIDAGATFQAGNTFAGLTAASYDIVVEDANGCKAFITVILNASVLPSITGVTVIDPTCGTNNGDITINATGGVGALQYSIDGGATFQASTNFTGLATGVYNIVVEDVNGCQATSTVTLVDLGPPSIGTVGTTDPSCGATNGTINIIVTGGTGAIQYSIDGGATFQGSNSFAGLAGATYNIVVQDANGCQDVTTAILVDAGSPSITSVTEVDASCGNNNGSISINVTGGAPVIQYSIDNGVTFSTNSNFSGLALGAYNIVVQDGNGCQVTSSASISQTGTPVITIDNIVDLDCYSDANGQVNITVTGGTGPYQYDWSNDGTGDWDDPEDLANGIPGVVSVTVLDANGCAELITATIGGPGNLTASGFGSDAVFGNDGSINLVVSGGTTPLTFLWSNGSTVEDPTGLAGNTTYTVTITDANGCTFTLDVFVGSVVSVPELDNPMEITVYPNPNNGQFTVNFENYTGDVTVEVVDIAGKLVYVSMKLVGPDLPIHVDLDNAAAGVYFVNVSGEFDKYSIRVMKK